MKVITGNPARKERFFKRPDIRKKILNHSYNGEHMLLAAPRRVGKTSVLMDLVDNPDENYYAVFLDAESINDPGLFFRLLLKQILDTDQVEGFGKFSQKTKSKIKAWAERIAGLNFLGVGVELEKPEKISFYEELSNFLRDVDLDGKKILMMIDEFPIAIEKIQIQHGEDVTRHFLNQNRALRQNPVFAEKICFLYTGSIGLFTVVKKLHATDTINDLTELKMPALKEPEAKALAHELLSEAAGIVLDANTCNYLLQKIEWWIPFYFQLMTRELTALVVDEGKPLNTGIIDEAFKNIASNGNIYFQHFKSRLLKVFKVKKEHLFAEALLTRLKTGPQPGTVVLDLAILHDVKDELTDIMDILQYDGYIVKENDAYRFYSPILKQWWK